MWAGTSSSNPASPTTAQIPSVSKPNYRLKNQGKRVAQIVKLKKEFVEEYKECHAKVWPEVLKQIKDSNIEDCELDFLLLLFRLGKRRWWGWIIGRLADCAYACICVNCSLIDVVSYQIRSSMTRKPVFFLRLSSMLGITGLETVRKPPLCNLEAGSAVPQSFMFPHVLRSSLLHLFPSFCSTGICY